MTGIKISGVHGRTRVRSAIAASRHGGFLASPDDSHLEMLVRFRGRRWSAIDRNRVRRRLREAARLLVREGLARIDKVHVVWAHRDMLDMEWGRLLDVVGNRLSADEKQKQ